MCSRCEQEILAFDPSRVSSNDTRVDASPMMCFAVSPDELDECSNVVANVANIAVVDGLDE
jgi:hypothetical protein